MYKSQVEGLMCDTQNRPATSGRTGRLSCDSRNPITRHGKAWIVMHDIKGSQKGPGYIYSAPANASQCP